MGALEYIVEGRETQRCWQDDANMKVVHGPAEPLGSTEDLNAIPALAKAYFAKTVSSPDDLTHFITVTERNRKGDSIGQRVFTIFDFTDATNGQSFRAVASIAARLIENGQTMGVSE